MNKHLFQKIFQGQSSYRFCFNLSGSTVKGEAILKTPMENSTSESTNTSSKLYNQTYHSDDKFVQKEDVYVDRHCGNSPQQTQEMLKELKIKDISDLMKIAIPEEIISSSFDDFKAMTQEELQKDLKTIFDKNKEWKTFAGQGYYGTHTPLVVQNQILENPQWYTSYTPYQAEISQGRLEGLFIYQTLIAELTGLDYSNASLLDEGSAAVEAVNLAYANNKGKQKKLLVIGTWENTVNCLKTRAKTLEFEIIYQDNLTNLEKYNPNEFFAVLVQASNRFGQVLDPTEQFKSFPKATKIVACDLLSMMINKSPKQMGADIAIGHCQRFGNPMLFGGPSASFIAVLKQNLRKIPGRIVGQSVDVYGQKAYRLALQTREQHIKRDKSTSNICTAQCLLANINAFYSVYNGREGLLEIAERVHYLTREFKRNLVKNEVQVLNAEQDFFDTITIQGDKQYITQLQNRLKLNDIQIYQHDPKHVSISFDQTSTIEDIKTLFNLIVDKVNVQIDIQPFEKGAFVKREQNFLQQQIFNNHFSETSMNRYLQRLTTKDISLAFSMIPLGSCTMKLNSRYTLNQLVSAKSANIHPYNSHQQQGYQELVSRLDKLLSNILGMDKMSFQMAAGATGEYMGLQTIKDYHIKNGGGKTKRNILLIPTTAHGTNAASASLHNLQIVGLKVKNGQLDMDDFYKTVEKHKENLFGLMITFPSTCGIFEEKIKNVTTKIHENGGLAYMDGANMNAMTALVSPGELGFDVMHINCHKTYAIPHGGGGPGVGAIGVREHLIEFLPSHPWVDGQSSNQISTSPYGNSSILQITYSYLSMLGLSGLRQTSEQAVLNANYLMSKLKNHYDIKYLSESGTCAHEFIVDCNAFADANIKDKDIAKRLIDYGFHAPTVSFPERNSLMIEPTESESKEEMDRFIDSMIEIRKEIQEIQDGKYSKEDNVLTNAPHCLNSLNDWKFEYSLSKAIFPLPFVQANKYWPPVGRVDEANGDRNFIGKMEV